MSNISVLTPVGMAVDSVRRILFQPFNFVKWLAIGFTAWLSLLANDFGSSFNFNPNHFGKHQAAQTCESAWAWIQANLWLVIPAAFLLIALLFVFSLLVLWVSCRGKFMFLDNVVGNRAEIAEPWGKFRVQGNSCFLFSICFGLVMGTMVLLGAALVLLIGWPDITTSHFGWRAFAAVSIGGLFFFCLVITAICLQVFLDDFVVPIMAIKSCRVVEGWRVFFELFRRQAGIFILYLLFRAALSMAMGFITIALCCLLCCTVLIPYVGTVILLPFYVFWRSYSIHFLGQFGDKMRMFEGDQTSYIALNLRQTE